MGDEKRRRWPKRPEIRGPRASRVLESAVDYAHRKGVLVVCAAGNDGRGRVSFPAAYEHAFAVAATQFDRSTTFYSNWGQQIDIAAPGGNTRVDQNGDGLPDGVLQNTIQIGNPSKNDYLLFMGTSMASPHAAGVAALIFASGVSEPSAVAKVLTRTAKHPQSKDWDVRYGAGIIDADAALTKTKTEWGALKLGLAGLLGLFVVVPLRRQNRFDVPLGAGALFGLLIGSAGVFFAPALGLPTLSSSFQIALTNGLPGWDRALFGASSHANPLFYSLLIPLAAVSLLYGFKKLRGLLFGLTLGIAAHLIFHAAFRVTDVIWIPNIVGLDQIWLVANALGCVGLATLVARKRC